jgi:hypothetical protein
LLAKFTMTKRQHPTDEEWYHRPAFLFRPNEIPSRPRRGRLPTYGNARLARAEDCADLIGPNNEEALTFRDVVFLLEGSRDGSTLAPLIGHPLSLNRDLRERHCLVTGGPGSGKTTRWILPALIADLARPSRGLIAIDAKGGLLFPILKYFAQRFGTKPPRCINFKNRSVSTCRWNPAVRPLSRARALEIAHAVCMNVDKGTSSGGSVNEAFWVFSSVNLLSDILRARRNVRSKDRHPNWLR